MCYDLPRWFRQNNVAAGFSPRRHGWERLCYPIFIERQRKIAASSESCMKPGLFLF
jgi:hypothetical protein